MRIQYYNNIRMLLYGTQDIKDNNRKGYNKIEGANIKRRETR